MGMPLRIISAHWTPEINWLGMKCQCGEQFSVRADRWWVTCPFCFYRERLNTIRDRYVEENPKVLEEIKRYKDDPTRSMPHETAYYEQVHNKSMTGEPLTSLGNEPIRDSRTENPGPGVPAEPSSGRGRTPGFPAGPAPGPEL